MSPEQRKHFYFPIWRDTAEKLDWKMSDGRLVADLAAQAAALVNFPDHAREVFEQVFTFARSAAHVECRAVNADDLRHACNFIASAWGGHRTDSSKKFSQKQINQFDRLCAVLRDPWDLTATIAWLNPAEDDRQRALIYLRKIANEGRLRAIALNTWGTHDVDTLKQAQLDSLTAEIRKGAWPKYSKAKKRELQTF